MSADPVTATVEPVCMCGCSKLKHRGPGGCRECGEFECDRFEADERRAPEPVRLTAVKPAPPSPPEVIVTVQPKPAPPPGPVALDGIAALMRQAHDSGNPKLTRQAGKIRDLLATLREDVAEHMRDAELRDELARLEARTAEIKEQLRRGPDVDNKAVREWAAANNVACPAHGRVPAAVVEAYQSAVAS